jgi:hypothetical protein
VRADGDGGAFGEENARDPLVCEEGERWTVEFLEVDGDLVALETIGLPVRVFDLVDGGAAVAAFGVAPVVLGDELLFAAGVCQRLARCQAYFAVSVPAVDEISWRVGMAR